MPAVPEGGVVAGVVVGVANEDVADHPVEEGRSRRLGSSCSGIDFRVPLPTSEPRIALSTPPSPRRSNGRPLGEFDDVSVIVVDRFLG